MSEELYRAAPYLAAVETTAPGERSPGFSKVQTYLERFGYLAESTSREIGVLDDPTEGALRNFQEFFNLPVTGVFDDATREAMMRPRCAPVRSDRVALFPAKPSFRPDLLKDGFNCPDRCPDGVHSVFVRGERTENVALWGRDRYIAGEANFLKSKVSRDRWRASSSISCRA